jgi:hypothetical protein
MIPFRIDLDRLEDISKWLPKDIMDHHLSLVCFLDPFFLMLHKDLIHSCTNIWVLCFVGKEKNKMKIRRRIIRWADGQ